MAEVGNIPVAGSVSCLDASSVAVDCSAGPVTIAEFTPSGALQAGEDYLIDVNQSSQGIGGYQDGTPVAATFGDVRAQTSFTAGQYPLKYTWGSVSNAGAVGGSYLQGQYADATQAFAFKGTSVSLIMWAGPDRGMATVSITGSSVNETIDTYQAAAGDKSFTWTGLSNKKHTVTLTVNGTENPASTSALIGFDAVQVNGSPFAPKLTTTWSDGPGFGYRFSSQTGPR